MQYSKSTILPIFGLLVLVFFIGLSYFNNQILLDKIIPCSLILAVVFFAKMRGENNNNHSNTDGNNYSNPT
ncbi:MAG: hypothetical protein GYB35_00380 [Algicola sp.]|nr:hypothetical protein [Algicola sp.]